MGNSDVFVLAVRLFRHCETMHLRQRRTDEQTFAENFLICLRRHFFQALRKMFKVCSFREYFSQTVKGMVPFTATSFGRFARCFCAKLLVTMGLFNVAQRRFEILTGRQ